MAVWTGLPSEVWLFMKLFFLFVLRYANLLLNQQGNRKIIV